MTIDQAMQQGTQHLLAGRLHEAEKLCRLVLQQNPNHANALHMLGVIAKQTGHLDAAADLMARAVKLSPGNADLRNNLGVTLKDQGKFPQAMAEFQEAIRLNPRNPAAHNNLGTVITPTDKTDQRHIACFRRAIELKPDSAEAYNNLAVALRPLGKLDETVASLRRAIELKPDYAIAYNNLGNALTDEGKFDESAAALRTAIQLNPAYPEAHSNLGNTLRCQRLYDQSIASVRRAIQLKPDYAEAYNNLGLALYGLRQHEQAIAAYQKADELKPGYAGAYQNWGNVLADQGKLDEAIGMFRRAIAHEPELAEAWYSLSVALKDSGRLDEAETACRKSLEIRPNYASAQWILAVLALLRGDYAIGWREHEWRWKCREFTSTPRQDDRPMWAGQPIEGRTILLYAEQGFGDTLQFCRYVPLVAQRRARVILECQPALKRLLTGLAGASEVIAEGAPATSHDLHCPLMSLPMVFGTLLETVPNQVPYILPEAALVSAWRDLIPESPDTLRVGLVWAGSPTHSNDGNRSVSLQRFAPLAAASRVRFYSLQIGPAAAEIAGAGFDLFDLTAHLSDFADTAAMISRLDLVIAVDTAVAHLAGAMGKPVWLLLPHLPDWRWMLEREDTPWYPTMRLFRQPVRGDWQTPIQRIVEELISHPI